MNRHLVFGFVVMTSVLSPGVVGAEEWYDRPNEHLDFVVDTAQKWLEGELVQGKDTLGVSLSVTGIAPRFTSGPTQAVMDSLNRFITWFVDSHFELRALGTLEERVDAEFDSIFCEWGNYGSLLGGVNWEVEIAFFDRAILSLRLIRSVCISCNGHPYREDFFHYTLPDLRSIDRDSLFISNAKPYLDSIGVLAFRRDQQIPEDTTLHQAGYDFYEKIDGEYPRSKFYLCSNFQVTDSGLVYVYNAYTIASGAYGESYAYLSWEQLKPVIRPDGPLGWVLQEE